MDGDAHFRADITFAVQQIEKALRGLGEFAILQVSETRWSITCTMNTSTAQGGSIARLDFANVKIEIAIAWLPHSVYRFRYLNPSICPSLAYASHIRVKEVILVGTETMAFGVHFLN